MAYLFLFFAEIVILFLLSKSVSKALSGFMSIGLMFVVFLPGIIIHELSHLLMAAVLFVSAGDMEFTPKKIGNDVKLGSVAIAKTDPIRRSIIGFAPVFMGLLLVVGGVYLFSSNFLILRSQNLYVFIALILILVYLLFAISNTMFSSSKDMEGAIEILIALLIIFAGAYVFGFRPQLLHLDKIFTPRQFGAGFTKELILVIQKSTVFLLAPIAIDLLILGSVKIFTCSRSRS